MVRYRRAVSNDLDQLLDLIEKGFSVHSDSVVDQQQGKEHRVLFTYLYSKENWNPEWVYLAEESGRLLAVVGFFPQRLFLNGAGVPIWAVSPVVTNPEFRGKGYAGTCLIKALEDLKGRGIPGVFLWGLPEYYPRFGFAPILPRYKTKLSPGMLTKKIEAKGRFRSVKFEDLTQIALIYNNENGDHWLQPERSIEWWQERFAEIDIKEAFLKEVPFPKKENFLVWENYKGEVKGYINYLEGPGQKIIINESAAIEGTIATEMVASFASGLIPDKTLFIRGTPIHKLNAAAYRLGGTHINPAPRAGMVKIIDWLVFFNYLLPILNERARSLTEIKDGDYLELEYLNEKLSWVWHDSVGWEINSNFGVPRNPEQEKLLTKLILGFYDSIDLNQVGTGGIEMIRDLFPTRYPFIWDNNYLY